MVFIICVFGGVYSFYFTLLGETEQCFSPKIEKESVFWGKYVISGRGEQFVMTRVISDSG